MTEDNPIAHAFQVATDMNVRLNDVGAAFPGELPEIFAGVELLPEVLAQILMEHLPTGPRIETVEKAFWLRVMQHMGPDYIAAMRHVGAFMAKMDEF